MNSTPAASRPRSSGRDHGSPDSKVKTVFSLTPTRNASRIRDQPNSSRPALHCSGVRSFRWLSEPYPRRLSVFRQSTTGRRKSRIGHRQSRPARRLRAARAWGTILPMGPLESLGARVSDIPRRVSTLIVVKNGRDLARRSRDEQIREAPPCPRPMRRQPPRRACRQSSEPAEASWRFRRRPISRRSGYQQPTPPQATGLVESPTCAGADELHRSSPDFRRPSL